MVKLVSPMHSYSAHGRFGDVVYTGRTARQYVKPTQANTTDQGNVRQAFTATQKALNITGPLTRTALKTLYGSISWYAKSVGETLGPELTNWSAAVTEFTTFTNQAAWDTAAETIGISDSNISYAGDAPYSAGLALFAVARMRYVNGIGTQPVDSNSAAIATEITA